jgi:hypothetical protein
MHDNGDGRQVDELLDEAEAFERGGEPLEALARARYARRVLGEHAGAIDHDAADELRARVDLAVGRHQALVEAWQGENAARQASYLKRERSAIGATDTSRDRRRRKLFARRGSGWGRLGRSRVT